MAGLRWGKSATMVILSLALSTSSKLGLLISMSRSRPGLGLALGVFLRTEYNRNRRFNFVGKGVPLVWSRRKHADCYSDSSADTLCSRPQGLGFRLQSQLRSIT